MHHDLEVLERCNMPAIPPQSTEPIGEQDGDDEGSDEEEEDDDQWLSSAVHRLKVCVGAEVRCWWSTMDAWYEGTLVQQRNRNRNKYKYKNRKFTIDKEHRYQSKNYH